MRRVAIHTVLSAGLGLWAGCQGASAPAGGGARTTVQSDRDGDGLANEVEAALRTDPDVADTDEDGLSDGAEVNDTGTDPLAADTDDDGLLDGQDPEPLGANVASANGSRSSGTDLEPNDGFERAVLVELDALAPLVLNGLIDRDTDVDVYDIGALNAGDHLEIEVVRSGGDFDPAAALFDASGRLYIENDDGAVENAGGSSVIALDLRRTSEQFMLAITRSPDSLTQGGYRAVLTLTSGGAVPAVHPQTLFLDFDGGTIDSPALGPMTFAPFDAGEIDPAYADQTETIRAEIIETVFENYAGLDVTLVSSDQGEPAPPFTTLHFGGFSSTVFGISEAVDEFNVERCDDGIIFTEAFKPTVFFRAPTTAQLAIAIGNVASHEAGHLLGLNHVTNPRDLMDAASPADTLLVDQQFLNSRLDTRIFPVGMQDSALLLLEAVGTR